MLRNSQIWDDILKEEPRGPVKSKPSSPTSQKVQRESVQAEHGALGLPAFHGGWEGDKEQSKTAIEFGAQVM